MAAISAISTAVSSVPIVSSVVAAISGFTGLNATIVLGALVGGISGIVSGGGVEGFIMGAFFGGLSAGVAHGIGHSGAFLDFLKSSSLLGENVALSKMVAHGISQGVISQASGGDFGSGALGAITASIAGGQIKGLAESQSLIDEGLFRIVGASVLGGTMAEVSGGDFENGAMSAAFVTAFNHLGSSSHKQRVDELNALDLSNPTAETTKWGRIQGWCNKLSVN